MTKKWGMKVGGCVLGGSKNIGRKEDHKSFLIDVPGFTRFQHDVLVQG